MVVGELKQYICEKIKGDIVYVSAMPHASLGSLISTKTTVPLDFAPITNAELSKALLELAVVTQRERFMWRLKVNGIPITREFKPQIVAVLRNRLFTKLVYDVSPILKSSEDIKRNRVNVTIKYEGSDRIIIEHVGLLTFYTCEDAEGSISLLSGALALDPGEEARCILKHPHVLSVPGMLRAMMILPNPKARTIITFNDARKTVVEGIVGGDEIVLNVNSIMESNVVSIKHDEAQTQYFPKELLVSSILLSQVQYNEPRLEVVDVTYPEVLKSGDKIKIVVANNGSSKPDRAVIIALVRGQMMFQEKIPLLEPGETTIVEIPVNLPRGEHQIVIRTIWKKISRTCFKEERINVKVD